MESHRGAGPALGPQGSSRQVLACGLSVHRAHWRPGEPPPPTLEQGPHQALPAHSVSIVSLSVVSTPGGLLPGLRLGCPGPRGRSSVLRGPACPRSLPQGPGVAPTPSAHGCRRTEAGSDCPRGQARPQPHVLVMDMPWGGKARAPPGHGGSGGQRWRWPLTWGPEEVRAGHGEGTTREGARCEKSQCRQELGVQGSQTSQTQLGRSLVLDSGSGRGVSCAAYFWCDLSTRCAALGLSFPICQMG